VHPYYDNRIYFKEINSLLKRYDIEYFATNEFNINADLINNNNNLKIHNINKPKRRLLRFLKSILLFPKLLRTGSLLYIFHDFELIPLGILLRLFKKKVIFDMHEDFIAQADTSIWIPFIFKPLIKINCYIFLSLAKMFLNFIILAEEGYKIYFKKNTKHQTIYNYPILNNNKNNIKKENNSFIYIGSITEDRGLWRMIKLADYFIKKNHPVKLNIIGSFGSIKLKQQFEDYIKTNNLQQYIIYHGIIPNNKTNFIEQYAIGLILLDKNKNYEKSMPTKLYEYMKYKIPVIITDIPQWENFINKYKTGYAVDINNVADQYNKCIKIFNNKILQKQMGLNGAKFVNKNYNWKTEEIKLFNIIKMFLN